MNLHQLHFAKITNAFAQILEHHHVTLELSDRTEAIQLPSKMAPFSDLDVSLSVVQERAGDRADITDGGTIGAISNPTIIERDNPLWINTDAHGTDASPRRDHFPLSGARFSTGIPVALERRIANCREGQYEPWRIFVIVERDASTVCASSASVRSFSLMKFESALMAIHVTENHHSVKGESDCESIVFAMCLPHHVSEDHRAAVR